LGKAYTYLRMKLLALFLTLDLASATTFTVDVKYECSKQTPSGCTSWTQAGTIEEETSCFPGDSMVLTPEGAKRMDAVQIGDLILGHDESSGMDVFTPIRAWFHRSPAVPHEFLKLSTSQGNIEVSRLHNIAVVTENGLDFPYAEEISEGSFLKSREGQTQVTAKPEVLVKVGVYAPFTRLSNFYVGTNASSPLLAHSLAHVRFPQTFATIFHGFYSVAELWDEKIHEVTNADVYVHPIASLFQASLSSWVMDTVPQVHLAKGLAYIKSL